METIKQITIQELQILCPEAYEAVLEVQKYLESEGEEFTPLCKLLFWLQKDERMDDYNKFMDEYPGYIIYMQALNAMPLIWDGYTFG